MVRYPITFLTSGAFIRVPNQVEEMVSDFKVCLIVNNNLGACTWKII